MATIIEKRKDGKLVSYKFRAYLGKQNDGRQIAKYCTWQIPEGLSPTRARKAAEKAAVEWEKEVRFVYERDIKEPERAAIREIENQRTDFVSFIENIFFPICVYDGNHKPSARSSGYHGKHGTRRSAPCQHGGSMAGSKGDSIKLLPFFLCASVSAAAGGTKNHPLCG